MDRAQAERTAQAWWALISDVTFVSMSSREIEAVLIGWLDRLAAALAAEPFAPSVAADIGAEMVRTNLTNPTVLARSAEIVAELPGAAGLPDSARRHTTLFGELASGYSAELLTTRARNHEALQLAMTDARQMVETRFRVVFDNAAVAIVVSDTTGKLIDANQTLVRMLDSDADALRGTSTLDLTHPEDRAEIKARVVELAAAGSGTIRFEKRYRRRDGSHGWGAWAVTVVPRPGRVGSYLLAVGEDTTERRTLQAELRRQALHDPLTGLPNRRHLLDELRAIIATAEPGARVGLCFVDLDGFKQINDRYGHGAGDRLLIDVAGRLQAGLPGRVVARIGGDEFVVLIAPPCDEVLVGSVAEQLLAAVTEPIRCGTDDLVTISASIGALVTDVAGRDPEKLLDGADAGLYRAKAQGRGTWVLIQ